MFDFTKKKWLGLPYDHQHRVCAKLLRTLCEAIIQKNTTEVTAKTENYRTLCNYMNMQMLPDAFSLDSLADRFHLHLKEGSHTVKENNLLHGIKNKDRLSAEPAWPIHVYLDNLRSAHNVGSIIRTMEAFVLGTLYLSPSTADGENKKVKDASMGAWQWVHWEHVQDATQTPGPRFALETSSHAIPIDDFVFPSSFTLILGNEEYGCSQNSLECADAIIEIPLRGRKNSLNVANAFCYIMAAIARQRTNHLNFIQ